MATAGNGALLVANQPATLPAVLTRLSRPSAWQRQRGGWHPRVPSQPSTLPAVLTRLSGDRATRSYRGRWLPVQAPPCEKC